MTKLISKTFRSIASRRFYRTTLLTLTAIISLGALVFPIALRPSSYPIQIGAVANNDITAPYSATFESTALTDLAKKNASAAISQVYLPSDPGITRTQIDNLHIVLNYITSVRADSLASLDQKIEDIANLDSVALSINTSNLLLQITDSKWQAIQQEALTILEQIMRKNIRDYQITENRATVPNLINLTFSEEEAQAIEDLANPFIVANSLFSDEETRIAQEKAVGSVAAISSSYIEGQTIVFRGQIISSEQYETLQFYGFVKPENRLTEVLAAGLLVLLLTSFIALYFFRRRLSPLDDLRSLTLISISFIIFLFAARAVIPNRAILPYLFPIPAFALILATLFNLEVSIIFSLVLSIMVSFGLSSSSELTIFYMITSLIGALLLGKGRRVSSFFWSGIWLAFAGSSIILAFRMIDNSTDWIGIFSLIGITFLNGFASASLALLIQYIASQVLGLATPLHLLEISRPDHPLLQFLLLNAPGTYQHSLQVSNLAEQAAKAIGADQLVTRVGALFHDCGKAVNASFFIENQLPGKVDSHEEMDPVIAAQTIINHVEDGVALSSKHRLPSRIIDFVREHHGTAITRYQYSRALELANNDPTKIDLALFQYPGPRPKSKETALLMLADRCEARERAELPKTDEELTGLIKKVIDKCIQEDQLIESNLTLRDLKIIADSFFNTLQNTHHPRLKYPESQILSSETKKVV